MRLYIKIYSNYFNKFYEMWFDTNYLHVMEKRTNRKGKYQ